MHKFWSFGIKKL